MPFLVAQVRRVLMVLAATEQHHGSVHSLIIGVVDRARTEALRKWAAAAAVVVQQRVSTFALKTHAESRLAPAVVAAVQAAVLVPPVVVVRRAAAHLQSSLFLTNSTRRP